MTLLYPLFLLAGLLVLAYWRVPLLFATALVATLLAAAFALSWPAAMTTTTGALLAFLAVASVPPLRRLLLTARLLPLVRKALPPLSQTERDALEAGTVWWDKELLSGKPDWRRLLSVPAPRLTDEEQAFLDGPVEELCRRMDDWKINEELHDLPAEIWQFMREHRFFGMIIPKRYGGLEFSALAHSEVVMKVASRSAVGAVTVMVPNSLGPAELLLRYGTEEQKEHYLPRLARGEELPCFALTGPEAGSDAGAMPDTGVVCRERFEGRDNVLGIRLNWEKRYITLGPVATLLGLAFKLYDPDHLLGKKDSIGITLALIPTDTPGVEIGSRHRPLNMVFQNGPNRGRDVFIPIDWIIGGPAYAGKGWRMLMECLATGRSISLPALSCGSAKLACRTTGAYSRIRRQFRLPIGRFEGVEEALGRMAAWTYLMDAARVTTAAAVDAGESPSVLSAIIKYHLTEKMRHIVNDAMDVHGGKAICMGPSNYLARAYQAIPIGITVEGANILTRSMIIFGQGAVRAHPFVLAEMDAAVEPDKAKAIRDFDRAVSGHMGYAFTNLARSLWLGFTGARFAAVPVRGPLRRYYRQIDRLSAAMALATDFALALLGGQLKRREKISARLGDALSQLYLASCTLQRFHHQGEQKEDLPLVRYALEDALSKAEQALEEFARNFPSRWLRVAIRWLIFPTGRHCLPPSDKLNGDAARMLLQPSAARDRLTLGVFLSQGEDEPLAQLDEALALAEEAEAVEKKLTEAVREGTLESKARAELVQAAKEKGLLDDQEAALLERSDALRRRIIAVDAFETW